MISLPFNPASDATLGALRGYLSKCQEIARDRKRAVLASISVVVPALDPLAVLEAIFDPAQPHFYAEHPAQETAISGAEIALSTEATGPDRFSKVQAFVRDTLANTVAVGAVDAAFGGPHFFTTFAFADHTLPGESFPPARVFVPRWQISRAGSVTTAVANLPVQPDDDLAPLVERIWRAHDRFARFDFNEPRTAGVSTLPDSTDRPAVIRREETGNYRASVELALKLIASGEFEKIVLARAVDITAARPLHPLTMLNGLRQRFPDCYAFSASGGAGPSFIGASPERLVRVSRGRVETEALAGSSRRGATASEDAALAAALLRSDKDRREHRLVIDSIVRRVAPLGVRLDFADCPVLRKLANVQHLQTTMRGDLPEGVGALDLVAALHPTPAVGGTPREAAVARIPGLEGFPRGLYAGALGWLNARGGAEFFVGLRSALIEGPRARVYAGAGIVAGSTPEREWAETELKLQALLAALPS